MEFRIIISGASGKLGSLLIESFKSQNVKILPLSHKPKNGFIDIDLRVDVDKLSDLISDFEPNVIIHLAGCLRSKNDGDFIANPQMALTLCEAIKKSKLQPLIISLGSASEIGIPESKFTSESIKCSPVSGYGVSKLCQTEIFLTYSRMLGFPLSIIRLFNLFYIEGDEFMPVADWLNQLKNQKGKTIKTLDVWDPSIERDFLPVEIAVEYISKFANINEGVGIVNLGSGKSTGFNEILEVFQTYFDNKIEVEIKKTGTKSIPSVCADVSKLTALFGQPSYDLRTEICKILDRNIEK